MSKNRYVNTSFWDDNYILDLDPSEKLVFLYCLTNPLTNIAGAYEIHLRVIAFHTGFDKEMIDKILARFAEDDKIIYKNGWILLVNFLRHQKLNPKTEKAVENIVTRCPDWIKDRLSKPMDSLSHLNTNRNSNLNPNTHTNTNGNKSEVAAVCADSKNLEEKPKPGQKSQFSKETLFEYANAHPEIYNPAGWVNKNFETGQNDFFVEKWLADKNPRKAEEIYGKPREFLDEPCRVCFGAGMMEVKGENSSGVRPCTNCLNERGSTTGLEPVKEN